MLIHLVRRASCLLLLLWYRVCVQVLQYISIQCCVGLPALYLWWSGSILNYSKLQCFTGVPLAHWGPMWTRQGRGFPGFATLSEAIAAAKQICITNSPSWDFRLQWIPCWIPGYNINASLLDWGLLIQYSWTSPQGLQRLAGISASGTIVVLIVITQRGST